MVTYLEFAPRRFIVRLLLQSRCSIPSGRHTELMAFSKTFKGLPITSLSSCETQVFVVAFQCKSAGSYFRGCGRVVDKESTGMWFEVTGDSKSECQKRAGLLPLNKAIKLSNMAFKKSYWHSATGCPVGNLLEANPGKKLKVAPVAAPPLGNLKLYKNHRKPMENNRKPMENH